MITFEQYITIDDLMIFFDFFEDKYDLFFFLKNSEYYDWIFFYNKINECITLDEYEYYKLDIGISFKEFIKPLNLVISDIEIYKR